MENPGTQIPLVQKSKIEETANEAARPCCSPAAESTPCCTPAKSSEEHNGACCAQPEDGSSCCDK